MKKTLVVETKKVEVIQDVSFTREVELLEPLTPPVDSGMLKKAWVAGDRLTRLLPPNRLHKLYTNKEMHLIYTVPAVEVAGKGKNNGHWTLGHFSRKDKTTNKAMPTKSMLLWCSERSYQHCMAYCLSAPYADQLDRLSALYTKGYSSSAYCWPEVPRREILLAFAKALQDGLADKFANEIALADAKEDAEVRLHEERLAKAREEDRFMTTVFGGVK